MSEIDIKSIDEQMEEYWNRKIVGMKLVTWANFETPIDKDEYYKLHMEFMVKTDEVYHDVFKENCPKGCSGVSKPVFEGEENV